MKTKKKQTIAIVGGGMAAASTAYFLTRRGYRNIVILERNETPGEGSTGRNAAILRTRIADSALRRLAQKSADFYRRPPAGFAPHTLIDPVGVYLAARSTYSQKLLSGLGNGSEEETCRQVDPEHLYSRIPSLARGLTAVLYQEDEGVFDVHAILQAFLQGASRGGAQLRTSCEARSISVSNAQVTGLETAQGFIPAETVVMAGGGWAGSLPEDAGYPLPLTPHRRHLLVTKPLSEVDRRWPVVWIQGDEFYFRPESGGLLMCGCDAVPVAPEQGETVDPEEVERIAAKASVWLPSLSDAGVAKVWAGMRTFAPDERFVVGPDPRLQGLYWVAALGGHGITCAPAVGQLAAEWIDEGGSSEPTASQLAPARLMK